MAKQPHATEAEERFRAPPLPCFLVQLELAGRVIRGSWEQFMYQLLPCIDMYRHNIYVGIRQGRLLGLFLGTRLDRLDRIEQRRGCCQELGERGGSGWHAVQEEGILLRGCGVGRRVWFRSSLFGGLRR